MNFDEHKELLYENEHNISLSSQARFSVNSLRYYDVDENRTETIRISDDKLNKYLSEKGIEFKDFKYRDFMRLKSESIKLSETF